ncbi:hypothetical protein Pcinc_027769, partial [Petrolisthes cinctipes]
CSDRHRRCKEWAMSGECIHNRGYMHVHCAESCDQCKVQDQHCSDLHEQCAAWANNGECNANYVYMRKTCARACTFCMPARDHAVPHIHANLVDDLWDSYRERYPGVPIGSHG